MKRVLFFILVAGLCVGSFANANNNEHYLIEPNSINFAAPVIYDRLNLTAEPAGTIVYDSGTGAFYGLSTTGDPASSSSWIQLGGSTSTGNVVSSGTTEKIERAIISNTGSACGVTSQSGSWISGGTRTGTGICSWTMSGFTATPACVCTANVGSGNRLCGITALSSSSITIETLVAHTNTDIDIPVTLICMGPK